MQLHGLMALEIAHERTREAEARARLRWGVEPEPPVGRRVVARLADVCSAISYAGLHGDERCRRLTADFVQPLGGAPG
jgi:hypothetical protein